MVAAPEAHDCRWTAFNDTARQTRWRRLDDQNDRADGAGPSPSTGWVEAYGQGLVFELRPGDIVIMQNLPNQNRPPVRNHVDELRQVALGLIDEEAQVLDAFLGEGRG